MAEAIGYMDKKIVLENNKNKFYTVKKEISSEELIKQMEQVSLTEVLNKTDRILKKKRNKSLERPWEIFC